MRFGILGPLEVRDGRDRPIALRHPAERRLLVRLLLAGGAPVPVDLLAADLAPDAEAAAAGAAGPAVFDRVGGLRRRLEPDRPAGAPAEVLVTTAEGYALHSVGQARDDREAASLVAEARAELAAGRGGAAGERAAGALALWRGPALVDAGGAPWAEADSRRLAALAADGRLVSAAALVLGRPGQARPALDEAQGEQPLDGRLWALRAATELALERDVEALRVLRRARLALEGAGQDRGPALRAMEAAVLRADHGAARALCLGIALAPSSDDPRPEPVRQAVSGDAVRQMERLPSCCRRLVALLATVEQAQARSAVGGEGVDGALLARAAGLTPALVVEHLDPAVAIGLVTVSPGERGAARFRPTRAALAVLGGLTPFERRCLQRLVGQAARASAAGRSLTAR